VITYLDLDACTAVGSLQGATYVVNADMTPQEMAESMGVNISMVRSYQLGEEEIQEIHFGYLDPFANFDPAWRGEFVVTKNVTQNTVQTRFWPAYDGRDPLMIDTLEGHPVANQYENYTDFLQDKYSFELSLYMLNRFSIGDARSVFGEMELYSTDGGVALYFHDAPEFLAGTETPIYRYTFGFDARNGFVLSSYTNMRLIGREGMLDESDYTAITRGMAYAEVREYMKVLPTAVIVDKTYFTLCYGKRLESSTHESQFELMIRFDIENNYAQNIYNNLS
jgi:hypothetical protein